MSRTGQAAMRDLRAAVFAHIQKLHLGFFDRYPVGRLVTRATNDVENVSEMFSSGIVALVTDVFKMIGFAVMLFLVDARLASLTFLVVPLLAVAAIVFRLKVREAFRAVRVRIARINAFLQEHVTGMKVVQLFNHEERSFREFDVMNADHRDAWFMSIRYDAALFAVVELASGITIAIIIWQATGLAEVGTLYVFIDWMRRFFLPLRDLSAKYSVMQSSMASAERIFQLLDTQPAVVDGEPSRVVRLRAAEGARGTVEFDHVSFAYQGEDWVLEDVTFRVAPGEKIAIVGATGAGKTTIIKLLTRLYDPTRGRILLDGVDLRDLRQSDLRRRVAMVLQDVFLFSGTIAENIAVGRPDVDRASIDRVARAVRADRFIASLPQGYDTLVRERASNFSAGERQLLSFARALAHGGDVLVLDEATSSIDSETEALIEEGTRTLLAGRTAIVIAHRLSTIQDVDRIHVLHKGRIVESGSHDHLLATGGVYHRLYRLQYEGQERRAAAG
jgi:ABC-type multidrug transport system fused ATPase/permease subunit